MEMQMDMSYVFAVVITGLVVVFLGLVLLIAFISIIGKIFSVIEKKKAAKSAAEKNSAPAEQKPASKPAASTAPAAPASEDDEVIAVISAAVAMMGEADNTAYRVKSVRAVSSKAASGNAWAAAGLRESTNPF